jgi:hypothetical protein
VTRRLNPPPGWPTPPSGWTAPPGWRPDSSWPSPPAGWQLWVETDQDVPSTPRSETTSASAVRVPEQMPSRMRNWWGWVVVALVFLLGLTGGLAAAFVLTGVAALVLAGVAGLRGLGKKDASQHRRTAVAAVVVGLAGIIGGGLGISDQPAALVASPPTGSTSPTAINGASSTPTPAQTTAPNATPSQAMSDPAMARSDAAKANASAAAEAEAEARNAAEEASKAEAALAKAAREKAARENAAEAKAAREKAAEAKAVEDCTGGYSPCLPPASDYDCSGRKGNGPEYVDGPVRVTGSDHLPPGRQRGRNRMRVIKGP